MSVKAFELVPAIERLKLMSEKSKAQIVCIECCGKNVYIGTDDCFVYHYFVEEKISTSGKITFHNEKQGHKYLALKKPVVQLTTASALNRILVLCDNTLTLLNMFDLEPILGGAKIKGVTSFCLNENPVKSNPFSVEICVALKRKNLQIYTVTEDRMVLLKDIATTETPINMSIDGTNICAALTTQYKIINYETGYMQELFPYDIEHLKPIVTKITKEEFLVSAPSALGMFTLANGMSQRPPLQWSDNLISITYSHPYVLALNDEFITVHSILDQQQKQSIPFTGGLCLGEFDGRIFVASGKELYSLIPIPIEKQIQALLTDKRVNEALTLAKNARKTVLSRENFSKMFRRIQQQAGFIEFEQLQFDKATELFRIGLLDPREVISLYPHMMPTNTDFHRSLPALHEIADITQIARGDQDKLAEFRQFLLHYLEDIRGRKAAVGFHLEIDTTLLKLYAEMKPDELEMLIASERSCDIDDCVQWLQKFERYHALALLYKVNGDIDRALNVWTRIYDKELEDDTFPGLLFIVELLANLSDHELVWKYVDWVLEKDQELGVKIFTERPEGEQQTEKMQPDLVITYLSRYSKAVMTYLEYLVFHKKLEKEKYHTHLSVLYLDEVLQLAKNSNTPKQELDKARSQLRHMLQMSNIYRVQLLLGKVKETDMYAECAILYGKLEEHDKALRILVHKLRDYGAAETYCIVNSDGKDTAHRKRLFQVLLSVYLDPSNDKRDSLVAPAVSLLNNNRADFDTIKVLQLIPDNWSIGLLSHFLTSSIRKSVHGSRTTRIERMVARGQNLQVRKTNIALCKDSVTLGEDKVCDVCSRVFNSPSFVRYPNGVVTHVQCAKNKHVCPLTGKLFSTTGTT